MNDLYSFPALLTIYLIVSLYPICPPGFRRRSLSDLSKRGRTKRSYWIDNPASDNEGVEYTVYQIEDIDQRVQRSKSQVILNIYFSTVLKMSCSLFEVNSA